MKPWSRWWFIDESGQFIPRDGEPGVIEVFSVPDTEEDLIALEELVSWHAGPSWRTADKKELKRTAHLRRVEIAREVVAHRWAAFQIPVELSADMDAGVVDALAAVIQDRRLHLGGSHSQEEVEELLQQLRALPRDQVAWLECVVFALRRVFELCRNNGRCPVGHFRIDPKLAEGWERLAAFIVTLSVSTVFPEVFRESLTIAMGLSASEDYFDVKLAPVDESAGVLIADVFAFTAGENLRLGDRASPEAKEVERLLGSVTV